MASYSRRRWTLTSAFNSFRATSAAPAAAAILLTLSDLFPSWSA